jgi:hypothetical protein
MTDFLTSGAAHLLKFSDDINLCIIGQIEDLRQHIFDKSDVGPVYIIYVS